LGNRPDFYSVSLLVDWPLSPFWLLGDETN